MSKLLVVDDEQSICWGLARLGQSIGHEVITASSAEQALQLVERHSPDVIVLDVRLPGMDGLAAMSRLQEHCGNVPVIVITAYGDLHTAVEAVRNGAFEYIVKPFDLDKVQRALVRALARGKVSREVAADVRAAGELIGTSAAMQEVFKKIALAADSDACVLLCGESGTGKELAARAIHRYHPRCDGPFVAVNVASLSSSLAESELFGHVRGSFTGAEATRRGLLAQADGGTLFLDEVADIPLPAQVKLLRVLEHGELIPVGANEPVTSHFRVISATHQNLLEKVKRGEFRHDLYFRLCAFQVELPPLRQRADDIRALCEHFLRDFTKERGANLQLSQAAIRELEQRPWYGNVRELRNVIQHATIVARGGAIEPDHFPPAISRSLIQSDAVATGSQEGIASQVRQWAERQLAAGDGTDLYEELLKIVEPPLFQAALEKNQGQCAAAARRLGLHRTTLRKKLDDHGISNS